MLRCFWLFMLVFWPALAFAQDDNVDAARAAEASARDAFRKRDFMVAAEGFAAAFRLDPTANTKYNEALAWSKAGEAAAAADAYEAALSFGGLSADLEKAGTDSLASLETKLGRLVVLRPIGASITVAHASERIIPAKIHLSPGRHEVTVRHTSGTDAKKTVTIVAGSDTEITFDSPSRVAPAPPPRPPAQPEETSSNTGLLIAGWTFVGLGAAGLIGMGVVGGLTLSKVSQYDDTGHTDVALYDEAVTLKTTTNALVGVGGGFAALGIVLLIVATVSDAPESSHLTPTPSGLCLRF